MSDSREVLQEKIQGMLAGYTYREVPSLLDKLGKTLKHFNSETASLILQGIQYFEGQPPIESLVLSAEEERKNIMLTHYKLVDLITAAQLNLFEEGLLVSILIAGKW